MSIIDQASHSRLYMHKILGLCIESFDLLNPRCIHITRSVVDKHLVFRFLCS